MHYGAGDEDGYAGLQEISVDEGGNAHQIFQDAFYTDDDVIIIHDLLDSADRKRRPADRFDRNLGLLPVRQHLCLLRRPSLRSFSLPGDS